jgi:hypothetical protein
MQHDEHTNDREIYLGYTFVEQADIGLYYGDWSNEDDAALEDWEDRRRQRLAEANEY